MGPKRINQLNPVQSNLLNNDRLVIDRLNPGGTFTTYYITGQEIINATLAQIPAPVFITGTGTYSVKLNKSNVLATGHYSYASGQNVEAIGNHSFIHSKDSTVTGNRSVVLGGENITGNENDTVYVPNLNVQITDSNNTLEDILVRDNNGKIHIRNVNTISGGSGLGGTNYVFVQADGTPTENAQELQATYNLAKTMSPSSSNRITVIAAPGEYQFPSTFVMDTEYIDLVSLTANRDVIFDLQGITDPFQFDNNTFDILDISECLLIDANNVYVKGIKGKFYLSSEWNDWWGVGEDYNLPIQVGDDLPNVVVENCIGGPFSFGGDFTFGSNLINVNGTFTNCIGGFSSFGGGIASGYFENCKGGNNSFGGNNAIGTFINCEAGNGSFGRLTASGYFENCKGGDSSFGFGISASGIFKNCEAEPFSFGGPIITVTGTFINCIANDDSFGGEIQGKLYRCQLTNGGIFQIVTGPGKIVLGIDGNDDIINQ